MQTMATSTGLPYSSMTQDHLKACSSRWLGAPIRRRSASRLTRCLLTTHSLNWQQSRSVQVHPTNQLSQLQRRQLLQRRHILIRRIFSHFPVALPKTWHFWATYLLALTHSWFGQKIQLTVLQPHRMSWRSSSLLLFLPVTVQSLIHIPELNLLMLTFPIQYPHRTAFGNSTLIRFTKMQIKLADLLS